MKSLVALIFGIGFATAFDPSHLRGRELDEWKYCCLDVGGKYGAQTFKVDQPKYRWILRESQGAEKEECRSYPDYMPKGYDEDGDHAGELRMIQVCKLFGSERNGLLCIVNINRFAKEWFLDLNNAWDINDEHCDYPNGPPLTIEYVHPDEWW